MAGQFKQYRFWATSWIVVVLVLVQFSGCSRFTSTQWNWFAAAEPTDFEIPERILPIWTDTVLHQPNQKGVRGFGGRLYFYSEGSEKPIPVDGNVTVYVFDGDYSAEGSSQPLKKYVIKAEQLKTLGSHSTLGYSYSTWIPWEEVGGPSRKLNLITRFDGVHGGTVISSSSTKLLPGVDTPAESVEAAQQESPRKMGVVQA
ncbi:MAG: hypothetical protein VX438_06280, partial [Planctomycetota bacterium]|nr:hypothetical protein [Planctomycetota bacterium]